MNLRHRRYGRARRPRAVQAALWIAAGLLAAATIGTEPGSCAPAASGEWIEIDYGALVDRRQLSHSGEPVGRLLQKLAVLERDPGARPGAEHLTRSLLDPLIEPYAFVLQDALDSRSPVHDPPLIEVGGLWLPGEAQPAWVELLRARRYLVESDGEGRMRVLLPWEGGNDLSAAEALRKAVAGSWSVLRHLFAAELRRLGSRAPSHGEERGLRVEFHVFRHLPARTRFLLGRESATLTVSDTRPEGNRPALDLRSMRDFLEGNLRLEGARLEADGSLLLIGSRTDRPPTLLGRPLELADLAVAYRAVAHGGLAEPYMSLDRGFSPQTSIVNYGGRLRDTALGQVSLLCDIRFKTFSLGLDIETGRDLRGPLREVLPGFRTHLERFSAHPEAGGVLGQQTRLWFYPDSVDLTVSPQGDLLAFRRVRMTASSERAAASAEEASRGDPPWTRATVDAINRDYDSLARVFPELADLDQVVRLLSLFTWLKQAETEGLLVPELDVLLALELPTLSTPRAYPQLLALNALPAPAVDGPVTVIDRVPLAAALERLNPASGHPLPARRRLARALAVLDRDAPDAAALLAEIAEQDLNGLDESVLDRLAHRAERLHMHQTVLSVLDPERGAELIERRERGEALRFFSVGIGGLDLGMTNAVRRARGRGLNLLASRAPAGDPASAAPVRSQGATRREEWRLDPGLLPATVLPDHGRAASTGGDEPSWSVGSVLVETGSRERAGAAGRLAPRDHWVRTVLGADGPEVRSRKIVLDGQGRARSFERLEGGRLLSYRLEPTDGGLLARALRVDAGDPGRPAEPAGNPPPGMLTLEVGAPGPAGAAAGDAEAPRIRLRIGAAGPEGPRRMEADVPRQLLRRLVAGREADRTPGRPLPGLAPLPESLGEVEALMVWLGRRWLQPPWEDRGGPVPGEEDPVRLARALNDWWSGGPAASAGQAAVLGTDRARSMERWERAPRPGAALLLLPEDAFPAPRGALADRLGAMWAPGRVATRIGAEEKAELVVLISAEPPGRFAARLRELSRRPSMRGKLLAAWSLAGPVREDLPASLLSEGTLAGLGLAESSVVSVRGMIETLAAFRAELAGTPAKRRRIEAVPGPFVWYF